ncbi:MAG: uroporphyrinogen decarboxylase family protein, partial [Terriglobales bacterium]
MAASGCDAVGVDWTVDLGTARDRVGHRVSLQGNLDPAVLLAGKNAVRAGVAAVLAAYGKGAGHVFNLGHGITQ